MQPPRAPPQAAAPAGTAAALLIPDPPRGDGAGEPCGGAACGGLGRGGLGGGFDWRQFGGTGRSCRGRWPGAAAGFVPSRSAPGPLVTLVRRSRSRFRWGGKRSRPGGVRSLWVPSVCPQPPWRSCSRTPCGALPLQPPSPGLGCAGEHFWRPFSPLEPAEHRVGATFS